MFWISLHLLTPRSVQAPAPTVMYMYGHIRQAMTHADAALLGAGRTRLGPYIQPVKKLDVGLLVVMI